MGLTVQRPGMPQHILFLEALLGHNLGQQLLRIGSRPCDQVPVSELSIEMCIRIKRVFPVECFVLKLQCKIYVRARIENKADAAHQSTEIH
jgi:hypothetical protein